MDESMRIFRGSELSVEFEREWVQLFARAYRSSEDKGRLLLCKYKLNESRICALYREGVMVGSYSGLKLPFSGSSIFLSTDTMSDGTRRGASVLMGTHLYKELEKEGVFAVCGYPNDRIRDIRRKWLGWTIEGELFLWVGIPLVWRIGRSKPSNDLWRVIRPEGGFFGRPIRWMNLLGRDGVIGGFPGLVVTLNSRKPGIFFMKVSSKLFAPRTFGYRIFHSSNECHKSFMNAINSLDLDTIDVP